MSNSPRANFRTIGQGFRSANNNAAQQVDHVPQQQQFGYSNNRNDEEPVVAWLNIMVAGRNGEKKKLGKGIPLRESIQLERAILDLIMDQEGNSTGFDPNNLKDAITIDIRPAGQPDADFEIAFDFGIGETTADAVKAPEVNLADELEPEAKGTQPRITRKRITAK